MSNFFTTENTNGFNQADLDLMNTAVIILLNGSADADDIKNACDEVNDNFEEVADDDLDDTTPFSISPL